MQKVLLCALLVACTRSAPLAPAAPSRNLAIEFVLAVDKDAKCSDWSIGTGEAARHTAICQSAKALYWCRAGSERPKCECLGGECPKSAAEATPVPVPAATPTKATP